MLTFYLNMLETDSDRDLFTKLYNENKQKLMTIARKIVRNEEDAEDAVHNCFLHLAENFNKYHGEPQENLAKLCRTITRNAAIDVVRHYEWEGDFAPGMELKEDWIADETLDVEAMLIRKEDIRLMDEALLMLTQEERDFLYMQYGLKLKPRDIAALLHMSTANARKKVFRCKERLAEVLKDEKFAGLR